MLLSSLWYTSYSTDVAFYKYIAKLNAARKLAIADKFGSFLATPHSVAAVSNNAIALLKYPMLTVVNNYGSTGSGSLPISASGYKEGTELVNVASDDCTVATVGSGGALTVTFQAGEPQVSSIASLSSFSILINLPRSH